MKYRKFFYTSLLMVLLSSLTALAAPLLLQVWERNSSPLTVERVLVVIGLMVAATLLNMAITVYRERFAKAFNKRNFFSLMRQYCALRYDALAEQGPTNLMEKIAMSVNSVYHYMTGDYIQIRSNLLVAAACLLLIALLNPWVALLMLTVLPVNYFGYKLLNKKLARLSQQLQQDTSAGFQQILSRVQPIDDVKQTAHPEALVQGLEAPAEKIYGSMARVNIFAQSLSIGLKGLTEAAQSVILLWLVYSFSTGRVNAYALMLSTLVLPLYFSSVSAITNANINKRDFRVAQDFQKELEAQKESEAGQPLPEGGIQRFDMDVTTLKIGEHCLPFSASGAFQKGDIIQICGENGSGKSTFAKTLLKFRPVDGVRVNGTPIAAIACRDIRQATEYVSQSAPIVCGTLRENLLLNAGDRRYDDETLLQQPLLANILRSKTLDTPIQENGANLSGGEKQRIALTRALLAEPDVLVLDEVCSNIDAETTQAIYRALDAGRDRRITFLIAHDALPEGLVNFRLNQPA